MRKIYTPFDNICWCCQHPAECDIKPDQTHPNGMDDFCIPPARPMTIGSLSGRTLVLLLTVLAPNRFNICEIGPRHLLLITEKHHILHNHRWPVGQES